MTSLFWFSIALGMCLLLSCLVPVIAPGTARRALLAFPRSVWAGRALALAGVVWVTAVVYHAPLGRFDFIKTLFERIVPPLSLVPLGPFSFLKSPLVWAGAVLLILVVRYMDDLLAPRMLGGLLMLVANPLLASARWHASPCRLAMVVFAYMIAVSGMILMLSPFRFRKTVLFLFSGDGRARVAGASGMGLGLVFVALAVLYF